MEKTKITIRVPRHLVEAAKDYASRHDTSLTSLISEYLRKLSKEEIETSDAPIVKRLTGVLPSHVKSEEYRLYLEEKHGGQNTGAD